MIITIIKLLSYSWNPGYDVTSGVNLSAAEMMEQVNTVRKNAKKRTIL
jgi:hypothetical protein